MATGHKAVQRALIPVPANDARLLGQRIMVGFSGMTAPRWLLRAIRGGDVGSVILFAENLRSRRRAMSSLSLVL